MERGKKREVQFPVKAISCLSHHEIWIRSIVCPVQKLFRILRFIRTNPYLNSAYRENSVVPRRLILRIGTECRGIMTIRDLSDFPKGSGKTGFHFRFDIELKILFFKIFLFISSLYMEGYPFSIFQGGDKSRTGGCDAFDFGFLSLYIIFEKKGLLYSWM